MSSEAGESDLPRVLVWASVLAAVALGAVLRFAQLPQRGLIYWDEGKFALEGIRLQAATGMLIGHHAYALAGKAVGTAKPGHALLIALAYSVFGVHASSSLYLDAALSVAGIGVAYFLGNRLFGCWAGIAGALLLAVSEYDVIYARSALSESDASTLFLVAVLVWLWRAAPRASADIRGRCPYAGDIIAAGIVMGAAFSVNYRLIVYIAVAVAIDIIVFRRRGEWMRPAARLFLWVAGLATVPIIWQIAGIFAANHGVTLFRSELNGTPQTYLSEVAYQLHGGKQSVIHFTPLPYLQWWIVRQGWLASALLLAAFLYAARRRTFPWLLCSALLVLPYVVWVFAPFNVPRNLSPALPFASMLAGAALVELPDFMRRYSRLAFAVAAILLAIMGSAMSWRLTNVQSGFAAASRYVETRGHNRVLTSSEIEAFYFRGSGRYCDSAPFPLRRVDLKAYIRAGYTYAIFDRHRETALVALVMRRLRPIAHFSALGINNIGENLIRSENGRAPHANLPYEYVRVYDLTGLHLVASGHATTSRCNRDHVI